MKRKVKMQKMKTVKKKILSVHLVQKYFLMEMMSRWSLRVFILPAFLWATEKATLTTFPVLLIFYKSVRLDVK